MRQVNFVIIFIFCLAFALFAIQNTEPSTIHVIPGMQVQAPISVELLLAIGLGAVFAWLFGIWTHWQRLLLSSQKVRQSNGRIQELESRIEQYQVEIQSLKLALPPAGDTSNSNKQAQAIAE
ncbi:MAG: LapA family protein [Fischerella sp.]|jgi:uncharacterized integral membrane protein|uniref:LapA family protein n=1 Tax=Fischerella sp. TaxID=1191 RepID=UPI0017BAEE46|nr:LapA family protein [Fischerella sp.]NWF59094.1 LapA family protein [Fischerella sp.]